ncbi:MAG: glutamate-1-semialdehyde 2,1-aminomutase [Candidatus Methanomethylicota archaeon]|uniref:Glutamate-1-semialdehyde 2,1-aminomutase n=1 Tax=Thermoproteota archaeon TaxID=2056631 RepID=A0A497ET91_9CREN|nr:MAG: glutamate-1-semialdehyde 2,1-aminomutase [Candidatus Verstraetearchaeota archaeon]
MFMPGPKSRELYERAKKVLPAGISYAIRFFEPHPFYVAKAKGCRVWDVDGNEYTDYWVGHGALILGHNHPLMVKAVKEAVDKIGTHIGLAHEYEVKYAEQVVKMIPSAEMVRFTNSGTEANMYAVRLARAYTKRVKIGKFEGGWHGGYDALHVAVSYPFNEPESAGLTEGATKDTVVLPYNDLDGCRKIMKQHELACVVIEPVLGAGGCIPAEKEFLKGLRELCDETGTLLIFDEVITGFRLAPGGGQEYYGVIPDITVLGKALGGGGLPVGGICSRTEIMELLDHLKYPNKTERAFHGGTYTANPLVSYVGCTILKEFEKGYVYPHINRLGDKIRNGLEEIFQKYNLQIHVTGTGSMIGIHFTKKKPINAREANEGKDIELSKKYHAHLLNNHIVVIKPTLPHLFLCYAHTDDEVEEFLRVTEEFAKSIKK